jgi:PAS domain S-box-containing protein
MEKSEHKILIVDDDPGSIQALGNLLSQNGFKTGFAESGIRAIELLKKTGYDLVLLDINMPRLDGYDTCKILKKNEELKKIPVIFLTANNSPEQIAEGFNSGGQDYIPKPFNIVELLSRIKTQLELSESRNMLAEYNRKLKSIAEQRTLELSEALASISKKNLELEQKKEAAIAMTHEAHEARLLADSSREALRESEERFRMLSENSLIGVFIIQNGVWKYVNPYMANALGYRQDEMIGASPFLIIHPVFRGLVEENMKAKLNGYSDSNLSEIKCVRKDGMERFVLIISHKVMYKGIAALIGNAIDITERKETELKYSDCFKEIKKLNSNIIQSFNNLVAEKRLNEDESTASLLTKLENTQKILDEF